MSNHLPNLGAYSRDLCLKAAQTFFAENGEALQNAARLISGLTAYNRCLRLSLDLREAPTLSRHLKRELVHLHRLLMLDTFGDLDSVEMDFAMEIEPTDPIVEDICLLADQLLDLLTLIADPAQKRLPPDPKRAAA